MQNTDQPTNDQVIENFFGCHGYDTKTEMLKFLFDMQTNFIKTGEWMEEYRDDCLYKFETLFDLVKGLNYVEDKVEPKISLN